MMTQKRLRPGADRATRWASAIGLAVAAGLILSGCGAVAGVAPPRAETTAAVVQRGGVAQIASISEMAGFDPVRVGAVGTGLERAVAVMDTLLYRDEQTDAVSPKLAAGISSEDGKSWVLQLREGVVFTDGEPLNADAVVYNIERHIAADSKSQAKSLLSGVESVVATGEYEVTFTLTAPSGSFPLALTGSSQASLIGSPKALADPEAFNSAPVGAGPFVVKSWVPDASLELVRNPDYWADGAPYLDGVVYTVMPDAQTRTDDLLSGGSDVALVPASLWSRVAADDSLTLDLAETGGQALIINVTRAAGADDRVREAIYLAIDSVTTASVIFGGTDHWDGDTTCIPFPISSPACLDVAWPEQDVARATKLIDAYVAGGGSPALELVFGQSLIDQATYFQQQLAEIGLDVTLRSVDITGLTQAQAAGDYDLLIGATASSGYPTVWNRLHSAGTNWGRGTFPDLDAALVQARDALTLEDRNIAWQEVSQIVADKQFLRWMAPQFQAMAHSDRIVLDREGIEYRGGTMVYLDEAWLTK